MNVVIFGASGGIGRHLVIGAAAAGHVVTAVARGPLEVPAGVRVHRADVLVDGEVDGAIGGQDVVLSALGIRRKNMASPWSPLVSPPDFTERTARAIVAGMRRHGVRRILAVSAAGVGDSRPGLNWMMRAMIAVTSVGHNYRDLEGMERVYAASGLDWCCVRPTGLKDGPVSGNVVLADRFAFNAWIARADVADWMLRHLDGGPRTPLITEGA